MGHPIRKCYKALMLNNSNIRLLNYKNLIRQDYCLRGIADLLVDVPSSVYARRRIISNTLLSYAQGERRL